MKTEAGARRDRTCRGRAAGAIPRATTWSRPPRHAGRVGSVELKGLMAAPGCLPMWILSGGSRMCSGRRSAPPNKLALSSACGSAARAGQPFVFSMALSRCGRQYGYGTFGTAQPQLCACAREAVSCPVLRGTRRARALERCVAPARGGNCWLVQCKISVLALAPWHRTALSRQAGSFSP